MHESRTLSPWLAGALFALASGATAQGYPSKPIRLLMPYPAGGATDIVGRALGQRLSAVLGQSVVVDNRPGASALVGTEAAARAAPDGYTLVMATSTNAINQTLNPKLPHDLVKDFEPIALVAHAVQLLVVHPSVPARSVRELVALARARPGQLSYASSGSGTSGHIAMETLKRAAAVDLVHVPYKGGAPALNDVLGGQVATMFTNVVASLPHVKNARLRALGVSSAQRSLLAPDVPTVAESGYPGFEVTAWFGIMAPAGTPKDILQRLGAEVGKLLQQAEMRDRFLALGAEPASLRTPGEFGEFIRANILHWAKMIRETGARPE